MSTPLRLTSSPVAGIQKRRSTHPKPSPRASIFASHARRKPNTDRPARTKAEDHIYPDNDNGRLDEEELADTGVSHFIPETAKIDTVVEAIRYVRATMFEELPATRAGMSSTRIAEVLNFRRSLPPLVSVAHIHTLLDAPTKVEKEIVELVNAGRVRRLIVPGRGSDAAGLGDCLVLAEEWGELVQGSEGLNEPIKVKFLRILNEMGNTSAIPSGAFTPQEHLALVRAGFLVSSSSLAKGSLSVASLPHMPSSLRPAGASRAQAGQDQTTTTELSSSSLPFHTATLFLSLPNTGPYLRLLGAGRSHLLALLRRSKYNEAPLYLLRDRWDGAVESERGPSVAKRVRGEFAGVLPGTTKKWKQLYGMNFRWVLEEAVGAGLIEMFNTGSVGPGVRCV